MKTFLSVLCLCLVLASPAVAAKTCKHCKPKHECVPAKTQEVKPAPEPIGDTFRSGFEVVAGFRWDRKVDCGTCSTTGGSSSVTQVDPFFLGVQQRIPINEYYAIQLRLDRDVIDHGDFVDAPHWNGAVSLNWAPFRR